MFLFISIFFSCSLLLCELFHALSNSANFIYAKQEIQVANQTMLAQIDETKEFINTQLNEARNRIIRMSLNIEMCMLGMIVKKCVACHRSCFECFLSPDFDD